MHALLRMHGIIPAVSIRDSRGVGRIPRVRFDASIRRFPASGGSMGTAIHITRSDHTARELRGLAAKSNDAPRVRRLLALALILEGRPRHEAAERSGMDRQNVTRLGPSLQRR